VSYLKTLPSNCEYNYNMISNEKPPQYMTSAELEEAIRLHREQTKKLLLEARLRRAALPKITSPVADKK
jgi:DNA-directed RNA polymerase subunit H (RpoH/RPB5)